MNSMRHSWKTKEDVLQDLGVIGQGRINDDYLVIGNGPPPPLRESNDEFDLRFGDTTYGDVSVPPDLQGITKYLRMLSDDDDSAEDETLRQDSGDIVISKLNPLVKEFVPRANSSNSQSNKVNKGKNSTDSPSKSPRTSNTKLHVKNNVKHHVSSSPQPIACQTKALFTNRVEIPTKLSKFNVKSSLESSEENFKDAREISTENGKSPSRSSKVNVMSSLESSEANFKGAGEISTENGKSPSRSSKVNVKSSLESSEENIKGAREISKENGKSPSRSLQSTNLKESMIVSHENLYRGTTDIVEKTNELRKKISDTLKSDSPKLKKERNVAIANLLKLHSSKSSPSTSKSDTSISTEEKELKLFTPDYFQRTTKEIPKSPSPTNDTVKNDEKIDTPEEAFNDKEVQSSTTDNAQSINVEPPVDPHIQESINKVNNWFEKPKSPQIKAAAVCMGPVSFKRKDANGKSPTGDPNTKMAKSNVRVAQFKPSKYADDLAKKYMQRSKEQERREMSIWENLEKELKEKDEAIRKKQAANRNV